MYARVTHCLHFFVPVGTHPPSNTGVIVGCVAAGLIVVALVVIIAVVAVLIFKHIKKNQSRSHHHFCVVMSTVANVYLMPAHMQSYFLVAGSPSIVQPFTDMQVCHY